MNNAIILAAGLGTRMHSDLPKCAIPILGKPMINYLLDTLNGVSVDQTICVLGHKKEIFYDLIKGKSIFVTQEKQLGTANAVLAAKDYIVEDGYTIILPGDVPLISADILNEVIKTHKVLSNDLTISTILLEMPYGYGRIIRKNQKVTEIIEESELDFSQKEIKEVNAGIFCVNNKLLLKYLPLIDNNNKKQEYYLTDLVKLFARDNYQIGTFLIKDSFKVTGINDLLTLTKVEKTLTEKINQNHLLNGVRLEGNNIVISPDTLISSGVTIKNNTTILGKTRIEKNAIIGPNSELNNAFVGENSTVIHSYLNNCQIGKKTTVGPFAHLRLQTIVGDEVRIGNYVEIKHSSIGDKTNICHLSYVGDTTCGKGVNIGCGVVTVNFDGKTKHQTIIGDNTFIGCNSSLIAPIKIGNNCFIAAGSTITKDLLDNSFAITRAEEIIKEDYASKYGYKRYEGDNK